MEPIEVKITIYRHAEAQHNEPTGTVGILDPLLTANGLEQSLTEYNNTKYGAQPDMILSSVSKRCLQTIYRIYPFSTIYGTQLLAEYNTGVNCNKLSSESEIKQMFPTLNLTYYSPEPLPIEKTWADGAKRALYVKNLVYGLASTRKYKNIVLMTHANFIYSLVNIFGQPKLPEELKTCGKITFSLMI